MKRMVTHGACCDTSGSATRPMLGVKGFHGESLSYLHGFPSHHTVATPTWGLSFMASGSGTPAAYNIA